MRLSAAAQLGPSFGRALCRRTGRALGAGRTTKAIAPTLPALQPAPRPTVALRLVQRNQIEPALGTRLPRVDQQVRVDVLPDGGGSDSVCESPFGSASPAGVSTPPQRVLISSYAAASSARADS